MELSDNALRRFRSLMSDADFAISFQVCRQRTLLQVRSDFESIDFHILTTSDPAELLALVQATSETSDSKVIEHTFESATGQIVDCAEFHSLPGVRALEQVLGRPFDYDDVPPTPRLPKEVPPPNVLGWMFDGSFDRFGRVRSCPSGTVPIVRAITAKAHAMINESTR